MKKLLLLLAVVLAFSFTAVAQYGSSNQGTSQTDQTTTGKKSKKKSSGEMGAMQGENGKMGKAGKQHTITGCISKEPNADGMYTLTNGHYKKGVEIGPTDKVKEHAGHKTQLTGHWTSAAGAGETASMSKGEKGEKHFEVTSVKHISETCEMGAMGKSKGKMSHSDMGSDEMGKKPSK